MPIQLLEAAMDWQAPLERDVCLAKVFIEQNPFKLEGHAQPHHVACVLSGGWIVTLDAYAGKRSGACKVLCPLRTRKKPWASQLFRAQHREAWDIIRRLVPGSSWTIIGTSAEFAAQLAVAERLRRPATIIGLVADAEAAAGEPRLFTLDKFVMAFHRCDREASGLGLGHM